MATTGRVRRSASKAVGLLVFVTLFGSPVSGQNAADAHEILNRSAELMGGEDALRGVRQVTLRMMTQWQRTGFRDLPYSDRPSFEPHFDVRDYSLPAWRNTREFGARNVINIVRDSVAITDFGQGFQPLSVAYVDERDELFIYTPDRLMVALLDAPDAQLGPDTLLGGESHKTVTATLAGRFQATVFFHAGSGLPTLLRFRSGHPNDFGLVQWGEMLVEVWYSNWRTFGAVSIPRQWDVLRVGSPYKRMTVQGANFDPELSADSFMISADLRESYWNSSSPRPMHEGMTIQTSDVPVPGLAVLVPGFAVPAGAVDTGDGWILLGAGQAAFNYDQGVDALAGLSATPISGVLVAEARGANGGVRRAAQLGLPIYASAGAEPFVRTILENWNEPVETVQIVSSPLTLGRGADRVLLAPIDLPDSPGSLILFKPSSGWLYVPEGIDPLHLRIAQQRADRLGWDVSVVGTPRQLWDQP